MLENIQHSLRRYERAITRTIIIASIVSSTYFMSVSRGRMKNEESCACVANIKEKGALLVNIII